MRVSKQRRNSVVWATLAAGCCFAGVPRIARATAVSVEATAEAAVPPPPRRSTATTQPTSRPAGAPPTSQPARDTTPYSPEPMVLPGFAGPSGVPAPNALPGDTQLLPIPDRWRIGVPEGYGQNRESAGILDPYNQNVLKGDYPIIGQDWFLSATAASDTLVEQRKIYNPSGVSAVQPDRFNFFGAGDQTFLNQNFILSLDLFQGNTSYRPRDIDFKMTVVENLNYATTQEQGLLTTNPADGTTRFDDHLAFQELFVEKHLQDMSVNYDVLALRVGIQQFNADFRGFLFNDYQPGVRLVGNYDNNKTIYNLAYFHMVEKDTNSGLNTFDSRGQDVFIANLYREDFLVEGYTAEVSVAANFDHAGTEYDTNGFLVRPIPVGTVEEKTDRVYYFGWAGDGHIGWLNITHQFYQALGTEKDNGISGRNSTIDAQFFALELSVDHDWQRYRASFAYVSGDKDPFGGKATGFDGIMDNPNFAGGGFSYFTRQAIPLLGTGTGLVGRNSFYPDLRTSHDEGQANFINPGLFLYNVGADFDVTPRTKIITNATYLQFAQPQVLQKVLFDDKISRDIGWDLSVGVQYRPWDTQNIVFTFGAACLIPGSGFREIYSSDTLYSTFLSATLTY
jgi:hypothetical protein